MKAVHVLLVYSLKDQELQSEKIFDDSTEAIEAYVEAEQNYFADHGVEIVLVAADSVETVQRTHRSYFTEAVEFEDVFGLSELLGAS